MLEIKNFFHFFTSYWNFSIKIQAGAEEGCPNVRKAGVGQQHEGNNASQGWAQHEGSNASQGMASNMREIIKPGDGQQHEEIMQARGWPTT